MRTLWFTSTIVHKPIEIIIDRVVHSGVEYNPDLSFVQVSIMLIVIPEWLRRHGHLATCHVTSLTANPKEQES